MLQYNRQAIDARDRPTALVCIAKDEPDFREWVLYHQKLGFDHIVVYQNDWDCGMNMPGLIKRRISGRGVQVAAYNHFLQDSNYYSWAAFLDCDEFLVLKKHPNVNDLFLDHEEKPGLAVNWCFFGSVQEIVGWDSSVLRRFVRRGNANQHIKMILNFRHQHKTPEGRYLIVNPHHPLSNLQDTNGNVVSGPFNPNGPIDQAQINHYYHKSLEEWEQKRRNPRGDGVIHGTRRTWFDNRKCDQTILDISARDFLYGSESRDILKLFSPLVRSDT